MTKKGFLVKVELDIQKVTCPGVWLCSSGKVSLQLHMLDSSVQTRSCKPIFPLQIYEKFIFSKIFYSERRLNELQRTLNNEWFYVELIQWQSCDEGYVLATFQTTLDDLLYPSSYKQSKISGLEIDLLMESTTLFPGTIGPKLEVSTKTSIEEILCDFSDIPQDTHVVNPRSLLTSQSSVKSSRPRKVCHSIGFSRIQKHTPSKLSKNRPIFKYRKPSDDLILRTNPNVVLKNDILRKGKTCDENSNAICYCRCPNTNRSHCRSMNNFEENMKPGVVFDLHKNKCSLCSTYEGYFSPPKLKKKQNNTENPSEASSIRRVCCNCNNQVKKYQLKSRDGSVYEGSDASPCACLRRENLSSLAQELHKKLSRTLDANSRFFQKCIDCKDILS